MSHNQCSGFGSQSARTGVFFYPLRCIRDIQYFLSYEVQLWQMSLLVKTLLKNLTHKLIRFQEMI
jgi:hypothetical protein